MSTGKSPSVHPFPRISIAEVEGTARSIRHRQLQFHRLQPTLIKNKALLVQALKDDYGYTEVEALFEFSLSLSELRAHYESLDFEKEVQATKTIENGNESLNRYVGVGIVYIVPRGGLYSILSPLCAAMAAGSCVIVELLQTTNRTSSALRDTLQEALSGDTFAISKDRPDISFLRQCTIVLQENENLSTPTKGNSDLLWCRKLITSPSSAKNVAFVDRTADLKLAARTLVMAKFGFGNTSPYAPDVVFVHEAVAKSFSAQTVELANRYFDGLNTGSGKQRLFPSGKAPAELKWSDKDKMLLSGKRGAIIELIDSSERVPVSSLKADYPPSMFLICRVTSTDEAIDLSAEMTNSDLESSHHPQTPAAAFIFASPTDAQYLANNVDAGLTCVNTFPAELLVGPKIPPSENTSRDQSSIFPRYKRQWFEDSRPTVQKHTLQVLDDGVNLIMQRENTKLKQWADSVDVPLKPTGQRPGKRMGFFDAAIILSVASVGVPLLLGLGFVGRVLLRRYSSGKLVLY